MDDATVASTAAPDGKLILVVDDEFDLVATYTMLFEFHGYRVASAANGNEALAVAALQRPDLVLSDFMMPQMNGVELCRRWRADPGLAAIPFILTSAGQTEPAGAPCDLFLRKPVRIDYLLEQIDRLING